MKKLLIIISISIGAWMGWWIGKHVGFMTAYFLGVAGASAGLYFGRQFIKKHLV